MGFHRKSDELLKDLKYFKVTGWCFGAVNKKSQTKTFGVKRILNGKK